MRMMDLQALRYALATAPNPLEDPLTALRRQYVSQNPYLPSMPLPAGTTPASTTTEAKQVSNQIPVQSASARASTPPPLMKAERLNPEVDEDRHVARPYQASQGRGILSVLANRPGASSPDTIAPKAFYPVGVKAPGAAPMANPAYVDDEGALV